MPRKIFILDDNSLDREMCRRFLARSAPQETFLCLEHASLEGAGDAVRAVKPHCMLLDYFLKDGTGVDFLRHVHAGGGFPDFAVVMLTGSGDETVAAESIKSGAHEYLSKDKLSPLRLRGAVESALRCKAEREESFQFILRKLQEENERKDRILSSLHHELRTSLTPIMLAAGILKDLPESSHTTKKAAEMILKGAESQSRVIDNILGTGLTRPFGDCMAAAANGAKPCGKTTNGK